MALPKLNTPTYELELPSTGETIKYRPFLIKEQKLLLIAQESNKEKDIARSMGALVSECTFKKVDAKLNPMFDIEYVFLKIRSKSVGESVELNLTCPDDEVTKVKHTIAIDSIDINIKKDHSKEVQLTDDIKLTFRYPVMSDLINMGADTGPTEQIFHLLSSCIETIESGDDVHRRSDITKKEIEEFIDSFSNEQFEKVTSFFDTMPKLRHVIEVTNPKTNVKSEITLEGLESFLG